MRERKQRRPTLRNLGQIRQGRRGVGGEVFRACLGRDSTNWWRWMLWLHTTRYVSLYEKQEAAFAPNNWR